MSGCIGVIMEGARREPGIWKNIVSVFFHKKDVRIIVLPAQMNIYMLWKQMVMDQFETDTIELVRNVSDDVKTNLDGLTRDDFQEIYLFFDLDPQQQNLGHEDRLNATGVLSEMIKVFNNETENGKLYISYPMSEALRDYRKGSCRAFTDCYYPLSKISSYKRDSGDGNENSDIRKYTRDRWDDIVASYLCRCSCLLRGHIDRDELRKWFYETVDVEALFEMQQRVISEKHSIFVLSAFPEFLLEYFKREYWDSLEQKLEEVTNVDCQYESV
ncbi:MAG: hypothetical protein IJQ21_13835 [Lachnospiraceae bacterium]|nr:hypothetical protein [Lachnospiraceae bacterium]